MAGKFTRQAMQVRLDEIRAEIEAIEAKSAPLRVRRDAMARAARAAEDRANTGIREAEQGLFDLKTEFGMIARALGGRALSDAVG